MAGPALNGGETPEAVAEARAALTSLLEKCRKAQAGRLSPGRQTLMARRIAALELALRLIAREAGPPGKG